MIRRYGFILVLLSAATLLVLVYGSVEGQTGQVVLLEAPGPNPAVIQVEPSRTPSPTLPPTITPTLSPTPAPPSETPLPTDTPGPYEYTVQSGDTCISIAYQYGHLHPDVIGQIESLNGIRCSMLSAGTVLLIPRPTSTPTPVGADLTQTAIATSAPPMVTLDAASFSVQQYVVQDGDTLSSISIQHDSSLRQLCELNPLPDGLDCGGCEWVSAHCCCPRPPLLVVGKALNVPAPPPTPTPTPTLTGSETPTATPTHHPPQPVYPPAGAEVAGPVRLTWLTVGVLSENEYYLVTVRNELTGEVFSASTRQLSYDIPQEYLPAGGDSQTFAWQVSVVRLGEDGLYYPVSLALPEQRFTWQGWQ